VTAPAPVVSIVLAVHDGARYLDEAIGSCVGQTLRDLELIVVDDASTDRTPEVIERWAGADPRVRPIRQPANRGLPAALNAGFAEARGRYLTWTSDDNLYRPEALATMVRHLESHPRAGMVYADYTRIDGAGAAIGRTTVGPPGDLASANVVGACFLYRRQVAERIGRYAEDLFCAEDYDFWLRASIEFSLVPLHEDLYLYRVHGASLTETRGQRVAAATEEALARSLPRMRWLSGPQRAAGHVALALMALGRGRGLLARRRALAALAASPAAVLGPDLRGRFATALLGRGCAALVRGLPCGRMPLFNQNKIRGRGDSR
jgi:glycosyltransferase involved in cell wall biosynthesis